MDVEVKNKYCGYIMFNTSSASSKGPGSRGNDLILNNYDASSFSNCDSDLFPQTGATNNSMAAGAAAIDEQDIKKEDNSFQIYDLSNNNDNGKKLPGSSKMQPEKRPPRPPNAFILYRRAKQPAILAAHRNLTNAEISRYISSCWKSETDEERLAWERYADQKKLEHMQAYPNYVYRPNKNKGKNEKRRQARKSAVATFASQDTTTTTSNNNSYEGEETGPIRSKKNKGQNRLNNLVGRIEMNKVAPDFQNIPMITPPLSSPNTPTLMSQNNNNNNNNNNLIYTTMPMPFSEPEDIMSNALTQGLQLQQMQEFLLHHHQQNNGLNLLSFPDLSPGSFNEQTVDPSIFSFPSGEDFYHSNNSSFDSTTTNNSDLHIQKINTSSCSFPEFRDNTQGLADIFTGIHNFESTYQY
uniref:Silenced mating-type M-specific polypeptide Mc n=1 Tax=Anthurium amnicola TaxID=1678845 RepID=A0A1D1XUI9_9ARAE